MAWFKKERKPRTSERIKLEIPPDAWEKCEECGHIDIKEKFLRALNVCPNCGHHRRIPAQEYIDLLVDEGSWHETETKLKSADPLKFENYANRLEASVKKAGPLDAIRTGFARLEGIAINLGVMDFAFMGGSMGAVVGEKIRVTWRRARRRVARRFPMRERCGMVSRGASRRGTRTRSKRRSKHAASIPWLITRATTIAPSM